MAGFLGDRGNVFPIPNVLSSGGREFGAAGSNCHSSIGMEPHIELAGWG
jgi:hypothetical protein